MPKNFIQAFIRSTTKAMYEYAKSEVPAQDDPNEPRYRALFSYLLFKTYRAGPRNAQSVVIKM
jgi:hypothetical protein